MSTMTSLEKSPSGRIVSLKTPFRADAASANTEVFDKYSSDLNVFPISNTRESILSVVALLDMARRPTYSDDTWMSVIATARDIFQTNVLSAISKEFATIGGGTKIEQHNPKAKAYLHTLTAAREVVEVLERFSTLCNGMANKGNDNIHDKLYRREDFATYLASKKPDCGWVRILPDVNEVCMSSGPRTMMVAMAKTIVANAVQIDRILCAASPEYASKGVNPSILSGYEYNKMDVGIKPKAIQGMRR